MRRVVVSVLGVLVALVGLAGLGAADLKADAADAGVVLRRVEPVAGARHEPDRPDGVVFVLALGSDERPGLDGARADAIHLIGLNPSAGQATILNIPRDTWVDVPGHGLDRVNEAYDVGGAALQARTVEALVGVPIRWVLTTTFGGLTTMVDHFGGVDVDVPIPMADAASGADFGAGRQRLSGAQALAFARNRQIPTGDLARTSNQGQLIVHALAQLRGLGTSGTDVVGYLDVLFRNVRLEGADPVDLYRLGRAALALDPSRVRNITVPARPGFAGAASVVFLTDGAGPLFADFRDDAVLQAH